SRTRFGSQLFIPAYFRKIHTAISVFGRSPPGGSERSSSLQHEEDSVTELADGVYDFGERSIIANTKKLTQAEPYGPTLGQRAVVHILGKPQAFKIGRA